MTQSHFHPLGVQSHYFLSWVFNIVGLQISHQHSKPPYSFIGIQSHLFQFQSFKAILFISFRHSKPLISSNFRLSEPLSLHSLSFKAIIICLQFGVQSHVFNLTFKAIIFFSLAFRVIVHTHSGIQSHYFFFLLAFRAIFPQPYHLESQLLTLIFTGIAHLTFTILHTSSFSSPHYLVLITCSSCSSRLPLPLHMTQSFEHIFQSCCWTPYTQYSHVVYIGQSPLDTFFSVLQGGSTITHL